MADRAVIGLEAAEYFSTMTRMRAELDTLAAKHASTSNRLIDGEENLVHSGHRVAAQFANTTRAIVDGGDVASAAIEGIGRSLNLPLAALAGIAAGGVFFGKLITSAIEATEATRKLHLEIAALTQFQGGGEFRQPAAIEAHSAALEAKQKELQTLSESFKHQFGLAGVEIFTQAGRAATASGGILGAGAAAVTHEDGLNAFQRERKQNEEDIQRIRESEIEDVRAQAVIEERLASISHEKVDGSTREAALESAKLEFLRKQDEIYAKLNKPGAGPELGRALDAAGKEYADTLTRINREYDKQIALGESAIRVATFRGTAEEKTEFALNDQLATQEKILAAGGTDVEQQQNLLAVLKTQNQIFESNLAVTEKRIALEASVDVAKIQTRAAQAQVGASPEESQRIQHNTAVEAAAREFQAANEKVRVEAASPAGEASDEAIKAQLEAQEKLNQAKAASAQFEVGAHEKESLYYAEEAAKIQAQGLPAEEEHVKLLQNTIAERKAELAASQQIGISAQEEYRQTVAIDQAQAQLTAYEKERAFQHEQTLNAAKAETKELELSATGQDHLARLTKIEEDARAKIAQYHHDARGDLEAEASAQEKISRLAEKASQTQRFDESGIDYVKRQQKEQDEQIDAARRINTEAAKEADKRDRESRGAGENPNAYDRTSATDIDTHHETPAERDARLTNEREAAFNQAFHPAGESPPALSTLDQQREDKFNAAFHGDTAAGSEDQAALDFERRGGTPLSDQEQANQAGDSSPQDGSGGDTSALIEQVSALVESINQVAQKLEVA